MRRNTAAALTATLLATGLTPLFLAAPASAAIARHYDDFNGDGYRDVAYSNYSSGISGPGGWLGGAVTVVYGKAGGLDTAHPKVVHQDSPGIPGAGEEDDYFGESLSSADLNKDGYADLIVGNGTEHVGSTKYRGTVTIVWGSRSGLSGGTTLAPRSGASGSQSHFGSELATGDFNGDGSPDLTVIGGGEAWLYRGPFTKSGRTGSVTKIDKEGAGWYSYGLAAGKVNRDGKTDLVILGTQFTGQTEANRVWYLKGASSGLTSGASKTYASRPWGATIGDFDKNGYGDIAVGLPDNNDGKGIVGVWRGTSSGPSGSTTYSQASSGVSGSPEAGDNFGYSVSAGDTNGDGYADLAVGVPQEDVDGKEDQGGVTVLRGGSGGLTGTRSTWIPQSVLGPADSYVSFGSAVRLRDLDRDGKADLTVGANGDGLLMRGTGTTPTTTGSVHLPQYGGGFLD
ncbi:FG-GAP and VCBS repeat-containing protein [Streptomyces sp. NRRL B-3229]|uniref:FG-GAP and VCBS repeat-containing protein n=1 Tax=Streptomyces sp. NRRL B-3229 TaxID=1463836 RepID=UPI0004C03248|nr:FG-GAP and VCBS repeat-containing protein [Streptomyces sp. NRRL B-3229]